MGDVQHAKKNLAAMMERPAPGGHIMYYIHSVILALYMRPVNEGKLTAINGR